MSKLLCRCLALDLNRVLAYGIRHTRRVCRFIWYSSIFYLRAYSCGYDADKWVPYYVEHKRQQAQCAFSSTFRSAVNHAKGLLKASKISCSAPGVRNSTTRNSRLVEARELVRDAASKVYALHWTSTGLSTARVLSGCHSSKGLWHETRDLVHLPSPQLKRFSYRPLSYIKPTSMIFSLCLHISHSIGTVS